MLKIPLNTLITKILSFKLANLQISPKYYLVFLIDISLTDDYATYIGILLYDLLSYLLNDLLNDLLNKLLNEFLFSLLLSRLFLT